MKENIQIWNFKTTFEFCLKAYSDFNLLLRLFTLLFYDFFSEEWDIVARNVCAELNWYLSLYGSIMSRARVHEDRDMERDYIEWQSAIDQTELRGIYRSSLCLFLLCVCVFSDMQQWLILYPSCSSILVRLLARMRFQYRRIVACEARHRTSSLVPKDVWKMKI